MESRPLWTQLAKEKNEERCRLSRDFLTKLKFDGSNPSPATNDCTVKDQVIKWNMDLMKIINAQNESIRHILVEIDEIKSILRSDIEDSLTNLKEELLTALKSSNLQSTSMIQPTTTIQPANIIQPANVIQPATIIQPSSSMGKTDECSDKTNDCEIIYFKQPQSPDIIEKVEKHQLPLNFYDYLNATPCEGCRGCDDSSEPEDNGDGDSSEKKSPPKGLTKFSFNISGISPPTSGMLFGQTGRTSLFGNVKAQEEVDSTTNSGGLFSQAIAASGSAIKFGFNTSDAPKFDFQPKLVFSSAEKEEEENQDDNDVESEPNVDFKPLVELELVDTKTGEEEEIPVFKSRAKIYLFDDAIREWKERGVGELKVLEHRTNGTHRILLRRDKVLKVACNQRITDSLTLLPHPTIPTAVTWIGCDFSEEKEKFGNFCLRFKTQELKEKFVSTVEDVKKKLSNSPGKCQIGNRVENESNSSEENTPPKGSTSFSFLGGGSSPKVTSLFGNTGAEGDVDSSTQGGGLFSQAIAASGNAIKFGFNTSDTQKFDFKPKLVFSSVEKEEEENPDENDVESEPAVDFKPLVELDLVDTKTGEEEESPIFESRAKIYLFDDPNKEWKERGVGDFKVLKHKVHGTHRMLLRRDKVLKVACNQRINSDLTLHPHPTLPTAVTWIGCDFSEEKEKFGNFCLRFKTQELKERFFSTVEDIKRSTVNSPGKSETEDRVENAGTSSEENTPSRSSTSFGSLTDSSPPVRTSLFGNVGAQENVDFSTQGGGLFSQAIAASGNAIKFGFNTSDTQKFDFKPKLVFSSVEKEEEENPDENDVENEPNVDFKPLVELDLVDTKTGEEEENPVFKSRAKIYLFDDSNKEWKERGVGDLKILEHKTHGSHRILLRRDKVLKVACNQRITEKLALHPHPTLPTAVTWIGCDFSEEKEKFGNFCLRFKTQELKDKFVSTVEDIKKKPTKSPEKGETGDPSSLMLGSMLISNPNDSRGSSVNSP